MIYELKTDRILRVGKFYPGDVGDNKFKTLCIEAFSNQINIIWYVPDYPERIRPLREDDFAKIAASFKTHHWEKKHKELLKDIMIDHLTRA